MLAFKNENKKVWDKIYYEGKILDYPDDNLVRFVSYLFKEPQNKKLLDLGFGSGNNLIHLIKKGFKCYGCEISPVALRLTRKRLNKLKLSADLKLLKEKIPYADSFFDIVVAWQVIYYNDRGSLKFIIQEMDRVLKRGGKFLVTLVKKDDSKVINSSDKISRNVYRINSGLLSQKGAIIFVVDDKNDIKKLFNDFTNLKIGCTEWKFLGFTSSHWVIYGEKI